MLESVSTLPKDKNFLLSAFPYCKKPKHSWRHHIFYALCSGWQKQSTSESFVLTKEPGLEGSLNLAILYINPRGSTLIMYFQG